MYYLYFNKIELLGQKMQKIDAYHPPTFADLEGQPPEYEESTGNYHWSKIKRILIVIFKIIKNFDVRDLKNRVIWFVNTQKSMRIYHSNNRILKVFDV
jgi:hypothetical protein